MIRAFVGVVAVGVLGLAGCSQHKESAAPASAASISRSVNPPAPPAQQGVPAGLTGWPTPAGDSKLTDDAIEAALLSDAEVGQIIGVQIGKSQKFTKPFRADDSSDAGCNIVQGVTAESFGNGYDIFGGSAMQAENEDGDPVASIYQVAAAYEDAATAQEQFAEAVADLTQCNGKKFLLKPQGGKEYPVTVTVFPATKKSVTWYFRYDKSGVRCYATFEGVGAALVQAQICSTANTRPMTQSIVQQIVDKLKLGE